MTTEQSSSSLEKNSLAKGSLVTDKVMNDGLIKEPLLQDSAATQPPFMDEHDFDIRLADNENYDGLTFEVIYGHAFRPAPRVTRAGEAIIRFEPRRQ